MAGAYSRVTVVGANRRVDVVLPADEAVGTMTGELIRMLDEPTASPPLHRYLVTAGGDVLDGDLTLAGARIEDGTILRLIGEEHLPPAPVVYDVAQETAVDRDSRSWAFTTAHRRILGAAVLAALSVTVAVLAQSSTALARWPALLAVLLALAGVVFGRLDRKPLSSAFVVSGAAVAVYVVATAESVTSSPSWQRWAGIALVLTVVPLFFALAGRRPQGALLGSGVAVVLLILWAGGMYLAVPPIQVAAVLGVVCIAILGFLPRAALMVSGIASLDDRRVGGKDVARMHVNAALSSAHEGLVLASVATAAAAALAGVVLASELTHWSIPLGCLLAFVLFSRARSFPLLPQVVALTGAGVAVAIGFVHAWATAVTGPPLGPIGVLAALAALAVLAITVSLSEHANARLRIVLDRVEMLAVVAMIPLVVGVFGTYSRLLDSF